MADRPRPRSLALTAGLVVLVAALVLAVGLSIAVGARGLSLGTVLDALFHYDAANPDHLVVRELRLPRTLAGVLAGVALGLSGAIIQGTTRNPLADPGLLGVNAGAALFVVLGISTLGITSVTGYVWFGFLGAALAAIVVYGISALGRVGATPVKLALAGAAVTAALQSVTSGLLLTDATTFDQYRFWQVGSLTGRDATTITQAIPFIAVGLVRALISARMLNALALGGGHRPRAGPERAGGAGDLRARRGRPLWIRDRHRRTDRFRGPHRASRRAPVHRAGSPLAAAVFRADGAVAAARVRCGRPRDRAPGRGAGRRGDGGDRRAGVHRAGTPPEAGEG